MLFTLLKNNLLMAGCCMLLLISVQTRAQVSVSGTVTDTTGMPIAGASISLVKKTKGLVVSYSITDNKGGYHLRSNDVSIGDTLIVQAFMLGFGRRTVAVTRPEQSADFELHPTTFSLPEVRVQNKRIFLKLEGDTISYSVSDFVSPQDRVLGDIIKKLPGVEMDENGKITYNGKDINRFYIDGENLLDGRYNIATKTIPSDMVDKVQVLENHQPIKSLKNIVPSNDPAMNIVLKDKAHLKPIGQGDLLLGLPDLYNGNINVMLFRKKLQFINYYKFNNTGADLGYDVISHFGGGQDNIPSPLMSIGAGNPPLSKARYLFNNSGIINLNNLVKLENNLQLRINASYLYDHVYQNSSSSVSYFVPGDTVIHYDEKQYVRTVANTFRTQFTLTANETKYYLNDVVLLENTPQEVYGNLQATGSNDINQQLSGTVTNVSNELNYVKTFRNNRAIEGYAYMNEVHNPATLQVMPGLNADVFNHGNPFAALIQQAAIPTFYTNNYLTYRTGVKFRQSYKLGFDYRAQQLNSVLQAQQTGGSQAAVADSFTNNLKWNRSNVFVRCDYGFVTRRIEIFLSIPMSVMYTNYSSRTAQAEVTNIPVSPSLSAKVNVGRESYFSGLYAHNTKWGDIQTMYDGYLMQNYRSFMANVPFIRETGMNNVTLAYYFKNTLKIFFFNINVSYSSMNANSIADNSYSSVLQQAKNIPFTSITENKSITGGISKYIFSLQTTFSAKAAVSQSTANQLLNGNLLKSLNTSFTFGGGLNSKITSWCNFSYTNSFSTYTNKPEDISHGGTTSTQEVITSQQQAELALTLRKNLFLKLNGEYYFAHYTGVRDNNALFADATFTYKWNKLKTDIEFSLYNLAGTDEYTSITASANIISAYTYHIRPRMAAVKFLFRF